MGIGHAPILGVQRHPHTVTLTSSWGAAHSGTEQLWSLREAGALARESEFEAESRLEAEVGYGLGLAGAPGVLTPYAGMTLGDGRTVRSGARWQVSPDAALGVEAHRAAGSAGDPDMGLRLEARLRF